MKYVIGASIGGLFGFSMPYLMDVNEIEDVKDSRIEESQPVEEDPPIPIGRSLILPDNYCEYITYESDDPKEQAKECIQRSVISIPPIQYVDKLELSVGDVIIDTKSGEIGLLLHRYDVLEYTPMVTPDLYNPEYVIWAWEILWTGPGSDESNRYQPYTEVGLQNMITAGTFEYIPAITSN